VQFFLFLNQSSAGSDRGFLRRKVTSAKGFNTRAARDLIDKIADTTEPVNVFSVHDADWAGTLIQHTLQHATRARAARKIEVIDLGLQPWEGIALGLAVERVPGKVRLGGKRVRHPVGAYVTQRTDRAPNGKSWADWLQTNRIELNALTSAELIAFLDRKMEEHCAGKLIPPDDILIDGFGDRVRPQMERAVEAEIDRRTYERVASLEAEKAKAIEPIQTEITRISAPLLAEISRLTAPLNKQLSETSEPFEQHIAEARTEAAKIDRASETHKAIKRITPAPERLRAGISEAFVDRRALRWSIVLDEIANATKLVEAVEIDLGDAAKEGAP